MSKHEKDPHKGHSSAASVFSKIQGEPEGNIDVESEEQPALISHESYSKLQQELNQAEEKATEYYDRMLRMQAETDNIRRRVERDVANAHHFGLEKIVNELLPVMDNMERSIQMPSTDAETGALLEGIAITLKIFKTALEKFGVEQIDPQGETFNPEFHQAVSMQVDSSVSPNTVLGVLQKGYLLNKRLIRPAFVIVSKAS